MLAIDLLTFPLSAVSCLKLKAVKLFFALCHFSTGFTLTVNLNFVMYLKLWRAQQSAKFSGVCWLLSMTMTVASWILRGHNDNLTGLSPDVPAYQTGDPFTKNKVHETWPKRAFQCTDPLDLLLKNCLKTVNLLIFQVSVPISMIPRENDDRRVNTVKKLAEQTNRKKHS